MIDFDYNIIYSFRRTLAISIDRAGNVIVKAPHGLAKHKIEDFIEKHSGWVKKHLAKVRLDLNVQKFSVQEIEDLLSQAKIILSNRIEQISKSISIKYKSVKIKAQKTLWGSCSKLKNINLNCLLVLTPEKVIDYVIIHELCHIKEMNHSYKFWTLVKTFMPDYSLQRKWLKNNGTMLLNKL